jgi:stress-induced morphogen
MIEPSEIERRIVQILPDAKVRIEDLTGTKDHYEVQVISQAFAGLMPLKRHRLVYEPFKDVLGGPLHALTLTTITPDEV